MSGTYKEDICNNKSKTVELDFIWQVVIKSNEIRSEFWKENSGSMSKCTLPGKG